MQPGHKTLAWFAYVLLAAGIAGCSDSEKSVNTDTQTGTGAPQRDTEQGAVTGVEEDRQFSFKAFPTPPRRPVIAAAR